MHHDVLELLLVRAAPINHSFTDSLGIETTKTKLFVLVNIRTVDANT